MHHTSEFHPNEHSWTLEPETFRFIDDNIQQACGQSEWLTDFQRRLRDQTGTRLVDWLDHITVASAIAAESHGYHVDVAQVYTNTKGIFPKLVVSSQLDSNTCRLGLKVDRFEDFLTCHQHSIAHQQRRGDNYRARFVELEFYDGAQLCIVERHGSQSMAPESLPESSSDESHLQTTLNSFRTRPREYQAPDVVFDEANRRFHAAANVLGKNLACDLFFQAEREYWQSKNRAGQVQYQRQQSLGLGWANHDHHTFRCSRAHFPTLIQFLETMGFQCRERFYAGKDAGWGAQVLEHLDCGIVIFADVDLSEDEVVGDFPHERLSPRDTLGTVGLWCALHGDSFTSAGMHHLECQFDFVAARKQLAACGISSMAPFTDFPHLKQAFTTGEIWQVPEARLQTLVANQAISEDDAERMARNGVIGSHLELLERNDGFKGFNQTGISQIILDTNPAKHP